MKHMRYHIEICQ